jgi:phage FluMu protein Com
MVGLFPTDPAPTLDDISRNGHELAVRCDRCRMIAALDVKSLVRTEDPFQPIDRYKFRCRKCGKPGQAIVTSADDMNTGRSRIWPH